MVCRILALLCVVIFRVRSLKSGPCQIDDPLKAQYGFGIHIIASLELKPLNLLPKNDDDGGDMNSMDFFSSLSQSNGLQIMDMSRRVYDIANKARIDQQHTAVARSQCEHDDVD